MLNMDFELFEYVLPKLYANSFTGDFVESCKIDSVGKSKDRYKYMTYIHNTVSNIIWI